MNEKNSDQKNIKKTVNPFQSKTFKDFSFVCGAWIILLAILRILGLDLKDITLLSSLFVSFAPIILLIIFVYHNIDNKKKKK